MAKRQQPTVMLLQQTAKRIQLYLDFLVFPERRSLKSSINGSAANSPIAVKYLATDTSTFADLFSADFVDII
jgi:hypothetical protein